MYYVCHGDNNETSNPFSTERIIPWEKENEFLSDLTYAQLTRQEKIVSPDDPNVEADVKTLNLQIIQKKDIQGKYLFHFNNYGNYFKFIKEHSMLFIAIVVGIWCINGVVQNEIDIKNTRRLEN